jgi:dipeptidyl aminopeptidase/acylaminoacyl peptidase
MIRQNMKSRVVLVALCMLLVGSPKARVAFPQESATPQRPFEVNDLFELEGIGRYYGGPYAFSPGGEALVFSRLRPQKALHDFSRAYLWGAAGSDLWIQKHPQEPPAPLTHGEEDGSGWWGPQWSPDGRYLAMLSTRGENVTLWVEDLTSLMLRQLSNRGVDLGDIRKPPYAWVDGTHILCQMLPPGERPLGMKIDVQTPETATEGWKKQRAGQEVTASVLESGVSIDLTKRPHGQLQLINVTDGSVQVVADDNTSVTVRLLSPNGKAIAYMRQMEVHGPKADEELELPFSDDQGNRFSVEVKSLEGEEMLGGEKSSRDALTQSMRWSPDGRELAFLAFEDSRSKPPRLYRFDTATRQLEGKDLGDLDATPIVRLAPQLDWTNDGGLIVLAAKRQGEKKPGVTARRDWWLVGPDGSHRCLTDKLQKAPAELWPLPGHKAFVGLADGKIWRLTPATGKLENMTEKVSAKISQIVWPVANDPMGGSQSASSGSTYAAVIFVSGEGKDRSPNLLDLQSGAVRPISKPAPNASFEAFDPKSETAIFYSSDRNGTFVWRTSLRSSAPEKLMEANTFLRNIADGKLRSIDYTSLDGEKLKAWIILPSNFRQGERYPMVTWVYAGSVATDIPPVTSDISFYNALNLQIPAAHGYAVLIPSMPLKPEGEIDDPMLRLPNGVLPAVEKAIELGIADPDRLFLMGQSWGGFSTYGLVTQTNRFKAAVSLAGLSDLISLYGQFDARQRYTHFPQEDLFMDALLELRMGSPPWKDLGRYLRNNPILYVDRVQTPVLIIQGDLDYVAIQQGEEFFKALYRQGKRARFVRYWGEGHVLTSPANIRDMWKEIFSWFDECELTKKTADATPRGH